MKSITLTLLFISMNLIGLAQDTTNVLTVMNNPESVKTHYLSHSDNITIWLVNDTKIKGSYTVIDENNIGISDTVINIFDISSIKGTDPVRVKKGKRNLIIGGSIIAGGFLVGMIMNDNYGGLVVMGAALITGTIPTINGIITLNTKKKINIKKYNLTISIDTPPIE